jgi:hypothetical protein
MLSYYYTEICNLAALGFWALFHSAFLLCPFRILFLHIYAYVFTFQFCALNKSSDNHSDFCELLHKSVTNLSGFCK